MIAAYDSTVLSGSKSPQVLPGIQTAVTGRQKAGWTRVTAIKPAIILLVKEIVMPDECIRFRHESQCPVVKRYYRWMRAEPPLANARTCSSVAMVVSPGKVVSSAPCAQPSLTASSGDSPVSRP